METFQILHLARSWPVDGLPSQFTGPPLSTRPVSPAIVVEGQSSSPQSPPSRVHAQSKDGHILVPRPRIRAAAAQIVFAARGTRDFITPEEVERTENWCGRGVLEALSTFAISAEVKIQYFTPHAELSLTIVIRCSVCTLMQGVYGS
jgi:uridine phosphorylase